MCYDKLCSKYYNSSNFPTTYFLILLVILPSMFSYLQSSLEKVLKGEENWKEEISCTLPPETPGLINFVYSVNGLLGTEAEDVLKRIVIHLMGKLRQPYSQKCMYVNRRVSITLVRGYIPKVFAFENRYPLNPEESGLFYFLLICTERPKSPKFQRAVSSSSELHAIRSIPRENTTLAFLLLIRQNPRHYGHEKIPTHHP